MVIYGNDVDAVPTAIPTSLHMAVRATIVFQAVWSKSGSDLFPCAWIDSMDEVVQEPPGHGGYGPWIVRDRFR